ncbi:Protein of unknown function [Gryllus bimaculatus]|nr:Protein of unknown function [Gryllus bimaculatus]
MRRMKPSPLLLLSFAVALRYAAPTAAPHAVGWALRKAAKSHRYTQVPIDGILVAMRHPKPKSEWIAGAVAVVDLGDAYRWLRIFHKNPNYPVVLWRPPARHANGSAPAWLEEQHSYVLAATDHRRVLRFIHQDTSEAASFTDYAFPIAEILKNKKRNLVFQRNAPVVVSVWDERLSLHTRPHWQPHPLCFNILKSLIRLGAVIRVIMIEENPPFAISIVPDIIGDFAIHYENKKKPFGFFWRRTQEIAAWRLKDLGGSQVVSVIPRTSLFQAITIPGLCMFFGPNWRHMRVIEEHLNMKIQDDPELDRQVHNLRVASTPQRLQLASVLLTSAIVVVCAYQVINTGRLFSLVTNPDTYPNANTIEDLQDLKMSIACYFENCDEIFANAHLVNVIVKNVTIREMKQLIRDTEPYAVPLSKISWNSWQEKHIFSRPVHIMRENLGSHFVSWSAVRNWPWTDVISMLTLYLDAGGIREHWFINYTIEYDTFLLLMNNSTRKAENMLPPDKGPRVLRVGDMVPPFTVLAGGLFAAVVAIAFELRSNITRRRRCS